MTTVGYCDLDLVRAITGYTETEIDTTALTDVASAAVILFNKDLAWEIGGADEEYEQLAPAAEDDTGTVFYTRHHPLWDHDGDATLTPTGDIECFSELKQNLPSSVIVSALEGATGKVTLAAARTDAVYAHYWAGPKALDDPDIQMAFVFLVASMVYQRLSGGVESAGVAGVSLQRRNQWREQYEKALQELRGSVPGFVGPSEAPSVYGRQELKEEPRGRFT